MTALREHCLLSHDSDYESDWPTRPGERRIPARPAPIGHDTDRYNGAIMRRDAQLSRFLMVYTKLAQADREAFVDRALVAGRTA